MAGGGKNVVHPGRYFVGYIDSINRIAMAREKDLYKDENLIRKIGGRLQSDYYTFKRDIEYINDYFFEIFYILGLTDNLDLIIDTLNRGLLNLSSTFINKTMGDIEAGKIARNKFLTPNAKAKIENLPPEEREKVWERETRRSLKLLYNKIYKENRDCHVETRHNRTALEICRKTLFVAPSRIEIDGAKFIEVYTSYMEADESETKKIHEQAAAALNRFFNGSVEITQKELAKYFVLEYGIVKVNPNSINKNDYARLGLRRPPKTIKNDGGEKE